MATKEEVDKFSAQYGNPLSGGVNVKSSTGEVTNIPYNAVTGNAIKNKSKLYQNSKGEWTNTPEVSIYIDDKTNQVTLKAPESFYSRDSFKQQFSENNILQNYAKNYSLNKNVQYANEDDPDHPYTTADLVEMWNDDLQNYAQAVANQEVARDAYTQAGYGNVAQNLTENDFAILSTNGLGEEATGSTLIAIPTVTGLNFLEQIRSLSGFDESTSTISIDDFRNNVYSLDKMSGDDLYQAYQALNTYARYLAGLPNPTPEQVTEWARTQALLSYMRDEKASRSVWEEVKLWGNVVQNTGLAGVATIGQTATMVETIWNAATYLNPMNWGKEWNETWGHSDFFGNATDQLNQTMADNQAELAYLDNVVAGANTIGRVVGTVAAIYGQSVVTNQLLSATTNYLTAQYGVGRTAAATATALGEDADLAASNARAVFRTATATGLGVEESSSAFLTATKSILALAKTDSSYLLNGTATLINMVGGAASAESEALQLVTNAAQAAKTAYIAGTMAGALSNIVVGTVALNGTTFRDYVATGDAELGKDLLSAVAWQAATFGLLQVWGVATNINAASRGTQAATQAAESATDVTSMGIGAVASGEQAFEQARSLTVGGLVESQVAGANVAVTRNILKTQARVGAVKESIKQTVLRNGKYIADISTPNKRQAEEGNAIIREAAKAVGLTSDTKTGQEAIANYVAVQNAVDDRLSGTQNILYNMTNPKTNLDVAKANNDVVASQQKLAKLEKSYSLPVRRGDGESTALVTDQYGFALFRTKVINNYIKQSGEQTKEQTKELEHWQEIIANTETTYPDLAEVVKNEQLPALYRLNNALLRYERTNQLKPKADLDFYTNSPLWSHGYIHTQRASQDTPEANQHRLISILEKRNTTTARDEHYQWGSIEDPVSLYKSTLNRMIDIAVVENARSVTAGLTGYTGAKREVIVNGKDYTKTKKITAINHQQDQLGKQISQSIKDIYDAQSALNLSSTVQKWAQSTISKLNQEAKISKMSRKTAKADPSKIKDSSIRLNPYKNAALDLMVVDEIQNMSNDILGFNFQDLTPDTYDSSIQGLNPKSRQAVVNLLRDTIGSNGKLLGWNDVLRVSPSEVTHISSVSLEEKSALAKEWGLLPKNAYDTVNTVFEEVPAPTEGMVRLYRGLEQPYNAGYDNSTNMNGGPESWADEYSVAHMYANRDLTDGSVYYIDVPEEELISATNITAVGSIESESGSAQEYTMTPEVREQLVGEPKLYAHNNLAEKLAGLTQAGTINIDYNNYVKIVKLSPNLPDQLNRVALSNSPKYLKNKDVIKRAKEAYIADQEFISQGLLKYEEEQLTKATEGLEISAKEVQELTNNLIDEFIDSVYANSKTAEMLDALVQDEANPDLAKEFCVLWELNVNREELGDMLSDKLYNMIEKDIARYNSAIAGTKKPLLDSNDIAEKYTKLFEEMLWDRRNKVMNQLMEQGSELPKRSDIYEEIRDIQKEIVGARSNPNMVSVVSSNGETEILEVDPMVADLVNYRPTPESYTALQKIMRNKAFEISHRLFRLSTTGVNIGSLTNQYFRDPLTAWLSAGTTRSMSGIARDIELNFGSQIADDLRTYQPEIYRHLEELAKERGVSIERQGVDYILSEGEAISQSGTETAVTRFSERDSNIFDITKSKAEKVLELLESPNEWRERGLRKADYARGVQRALRQGYNTQQAMEWGERTARDGTTEFGRMTVHMQAFTNSVPYLRSAINAPKSFYRMLSLDPIGMALRLVTGIFIPMLAGIISVVNDEDAKKAYKQLNEYEKDGVLIFNIGGSLYKIPIPQEAGQILSPLRSWIEKMADANDKDLSLLMANDLLGFSPMNWPQDILDVDHNILLDEITWTDRIGMGLLGAFSEMSPLLIKSVFEAVYGVDPYTGESIDKSYYTVDADGNLVLMDSETSEFAQWLGNITGWSPSIIAAVVEDLVGGSVTGLLDWGTSIATYVGTGGEEGNLLQGVESSIKTIAGKLTVAEYDRTKSRWNSAVQELNNKKQALMPNYIKLTEKINAETNEATRQNLLAQRQDLISDYVQDVKDAVDAMVNELGGSVDSYRFATVVSLLTFYEPSNMGLTTYSRTTSQDMKYEAQEWAKRTIAQMGIQNTIYGLEGAGEGQSLLGYYYQDRNTGETKYKFYTPLEILNAQNIYYAGQDIYQADIEGILKANGLTRSKMFENYSSLSKSEKKQYKKDWNAKVVKALFPYIDQYGAENVINNQETVDLLERYIFVDNPYTAKQYLQEIFGAQ